MPKFDSIRGQVQTLASATPIGRWVRHADLNNEGCAGLLTHEVGKSGKHQAVSRG